MNRRQFIAISGTATAAAITTETSAAESNSGREYYELRQVIIEKEEQKKQVDNFLKEAAIPALNRLGIKPVGVFYPEKALSPIYVLIPHVSLESMATFQAQMGQDQDFLSQGADFINAPASSPAFKRIESSLMVAFKGMPHLQAPELTPGRIFQLRTYESPSVKTNMKKIEMFNDAGEIEIFKKVGLTPVFFGQTLVGSKLPNLTYMLTFKNAEAQQAAWKGFGANPDWQRLSKMPEYSDKAILSGITNLPLVPADYSQI